MNRQQRRATGAVAAQVHTAADLQTLLDAANGQHEGLTIAVAVRCPHSVGTPGLVMNVETYIAHRKHCRPLAVSTNIRDIEPRVITLAEPLEHSHFCTLCNRRRRCDVATCLAQPDASTTCLAWSGNPCTPRDAFKLSN